MDTIFTDRQLTKMIELMRQKGMTQERLSAVLSSGVLADVLDLRANLGNRHATRESLGLEDAGALPIESGATSYGPDFSFRVNYRFHLETMIQACNLDWVDPRLSHYRHDPRTAISRRTVRFLSRYFSYGRAVRLGGVARGMHEKSWAPATAEQLFTFAKKYPREQYKHRIAALGAVELIDGQLYVPFLESHEKARQACLGFWEDMWPQETMFLVVCETFDQ